MNPTASQTTGVETPQSQAVRAKDLNEIWGEFHQELWKFIRRRVPSDAACDDLLQTAFLRATRAVQSGTEPKNPRAWLHQIARNLIIDSQRRESRRDAAEISLLGEAAVLSEPSLPPRDEEGVADAIARLLPRFVELLDEPYKSALKWVDLHGMTQLEAAEHEGVSLTCMKARVRRGRKQLLAELKRCCTFEIDSRGMPISCTPQSSTPCDSCS